MSVIGRNVNWNLVLKALNLTPAPRGTPLLIHFVIFGYISWELFNVRVCVFNSIPNRLTQKEDLDTKSNGWI